MSIDISTFKLSRCTVVLVDRKQAHVASQDSRELVSIQKLIYFILEYNI